MARSFNGSSDIIVVDGASALFPANASPMTVAAWIKASAVVNKAIFSIGRGISATGQVTLASGASNGALIRIVMVDNSASKLDSTGAVTALDGTWHHVAMTLDTSRNVVRYIDGTSDTPATYTAGTFSLPRAAIGALRRNTNTQFWGGSLAQVAGWTRTLTGQEVASLAAGTSPLLFGPSYYWPLFGVDSPEPDLGVSGTHVTGTLTGTAFAAGRDPSSLLDLQGATVAA